MNWGEFKAILEARGVTDSTPIREIVIENHPTEDRIEIEFTASGYLMVYVS